jgi:hypothetical protein
MTTVATDRQDTGEVFALVEFTDDHSIAVVSVTWLRGKNKCKWPPVRSSQTADKMARESAPVKSNWLTFNSRTLFVAGQL